LNILLSQVEAEVEALVQETQAGVELVDID
jgi:hypothetical protein